MQVLIAIILTTILLAVCIKHRALYEWLVADVMNTLLVIVGVLMIFTFAYQEFILDKQQVSKVIVRPLAPLTL